MEPLFALALLIAGLGYALWRVVRHGTWKKRRPLLGVVRDE